ncbi:MAG TPA: hypothetical protein PLX89_01895 [Verrucomicrobiota bacterium]|nr:hypothetical protein [Verrucomicrobiales bacterium]HRI11730.1 hypothetical protein [Verrucomicrobiota bacterium]
MRIIVAAWLFAFMHAFADQGSLSPSPRTNINPALLYSQAIQVMPDRSEQDHLFTNEWRGRELDERFNQQIATYDNSFNLLRLAARQKVPCDWGYDLSQGPELLLPSLAKAKSLTQAARLRIRWHLENGRPDDARDDFLAAFVLGRQVSRDGILISALVQFAIENILVSSLAENWFRLGPETLQQIMDGIEAAPARGAIVQCIETERVSFKDWLARKIREFQSDSTDESEALQKTRQLLHSVMDQSEDPSKKTNSPTPESVIQAAGGTTAGLLQQLKELDPLYEEAAVLMTVPYQQFLPLIQAFNEKLKKHPNQLVKDFFPAFEKCRIKEFAVEVKLAMLRAAFEYRQAGDGAFAQILDPTLQAPFHLRRFEFDGTDRGFEVSSKMRYPDDWNASLIFIEKDGPAFYLDGKNAGKPVK